IFFSRDIFEITLLLLDAHVSQTHRSFKVGTDPLAIILQRECLYVYRVSTRQDRIDALVFAILLEGDWFVFSHRELDSILETLKPAREPPEPRLNWCLDGSDVVPDLQSQRAAGVACSRFPKQIALLCSPLTNCCHSHDDASILAENQF